MDKNLTIIFIIICSLLIGAEAFIEGLYCGKENCYDVLGITRDATKSELSRSYRQLAKKYHPDVHRTKEAKEVAEEKFKAIATAYEVLRDEDSRNDYNYMLDNPDELYRHYYYYYRRQMTPKVDVRIVVAVTISVISIAQYYAAWSRYNEALSYLVSVPKYRIQAVEIAKQEGLLDNKKRRKEKMSKEEEEELLKKILEEKMDIKGGYSKPSVINILWIQIILFPYTLTMWIVWNLKWIWKFTICRQEYGEEEKMYLIKKYMKLPQSQWDDLEDWEKEDYLKKELWIKSKFQVWYQQKEDERKAKLAESARYKSYRRYMKNHGPGQISFLDDL